MKNLLRTLFVPIASLLILFGAGGCYTQLGTARNEAPVDEGADEQYTEYTGNEVEGEEPYYEDDDGYDYGNDWENQYRFGFNYYYPNTYWPSVTFAMIYADPWSAAYSYDPWYYRSYSGYYFPWYGYGYGYANYYSPWYGYGYGGTVTGIIPTTPVTITRTSRPSPVPRGILVPRVPRAARADRTPMAIRGEATFRVRHPVRR